MSTFGKIIFSIMGALLIGFGFILAISEPVYLAQIHGTLVCMAGLQCWGLAK